MISLYDHIRTVSPSDEYTAALDIANCYKQNSANEEAYEWFRKAIDLDSTRLAGYIAIGEAYADDGKYNLAQEYFEKALEVAPESFDPFLNMALFFEKQQQWEKAIYWYKESISRASAWKSLIFARIMRIKWEYLKKHKEAETESTDELRHNVSDKTILAALHELVDEYYMNLNDAESALGLLDKIRVIVGHSYEAEYQNRIGTMKFYAGAYNDAVDSYRKAIHVEPGHTEYHANLGKAYKGAGRYDDAEKAYLEAIRLGPDTAEYYNELANLYFDDEKYANSVSYYLEAVRLAPDEAVYHANLGGAYKETGQLESAKSAYQAAVKLHPHDATYQNRLGVILYELGKYEESLQYYLSAITLDSAVALYHANLGISYTMLGQWEEANKAYAEANKLDRKPESECDLGRSYGRLGLWDKMLDHCKEAVQMRRDRADDPNGLEYYYGFLAEAYVKAARPGEFEELLETPETFEKSRQIKLIFTTRSATYSSTKAGIKKLFLTM